MRLSHIPSLRFGLCNLFFTLNNVCAMKPYFLLFVASLVFNNSHGQQVINGHCPNLAIPAGYVKTGVSSVPPTPACNSNFRWQLTKYTGLNAGATINVCPDINIPSGWVKTQLISCPQCCGPNSNSKMTITKIQGYPAGITINMCPDNNVPVGWSQVGTVACPQCCSPNVNNKIKIKKNP